MRRVAAWLFLGVGALALWRALRALTGTHSLVGVMTPGAFEPHSVVMLTPALLLAIALVCLLIGWLLHRAA